MSTTLGDLAGLLGTGLRGLRSRALLTVGAVLLAAISVAAAVVGPMYQVGASSSFLVTKLRAEDNLSTGLTLRYTPYGGSTQTYAQAMDRSARLATAALSGEFTAPQVSIYSGRLAVLGGQAQLLARSDVCRHLDVAGRCATGAGQVMLLRHDAVRTHTHVGDTLAVPGLPASLTVVGTYRVPPGSDDYWFDLRRLESVPPQPTSGGCCTPYFPAPLIVPERTFAGLSAGSFYTLTDRRLLVTPKTTVKDLQQATREVAEVKHHPPQAAGGTMTPEVGNALGAVSHQVQQRRSTAVSTVAPAVVSVILVALVLLLRLLSAAMDLRRGELALASLRGFSRRQMWVLGLVEPVLMLVLATPVGVIGGYLFAQALAHRWLVPGLPVSMARNSWLAVFAVVLSTLVVAAVVVRDSVSEPLSAQIAGVRRPAPSGRWGTLLRLGLVAAAIVVLAATLASNKKSSPDATDLVLPILLAVAAGLVMSEAAAGAARWWARFSRLRRGIVGYVSARTISRRREGTLVILPLTAALAVSVFAAGVYTAAADWRASDAATKVGAAASYSTRLTLDEAVALTHQVDPKGRWLMAVGADYNQFGEKLVVDAPRLARVATWPSTWTPSMSVAAVGQRLSVRHPSLVLTGSMLSLTVDNQVQGEFKDLTVSLDVQTSAGEATTLFVGPFPAGTSTRSVRTRACAQGCLVRRMLLGGPATLPEKMTGSATISSWQMDGHPVREARLTGWIPVRLSGGDLNALAGHSSSGGRLDVQVSSPRRQGLAVLTPDDVPAVLPVVLGRTAHTTVVGRSGHDLRLSAGELVRFSVHPFATAESMPVLGPRGMLVDYTMLTRDLTLIDTETFVTILARGDTPPAVTAALASNGISAPQRLSQTRNLLDQDSYALALNLYLVVTVIVILLALAGLGANLAVQLPGRRRDAASLRVVGLRRRSIVGAVVSEFVVVLGAAALAGIAAGTLAQFVVVKTVTLGYADDQHTPRLLATLDVGSISLLLAVVTAILLLVAVGVAGLTVSGARTASLREDGR